MSRARPLKAVMSDNGFLTVAELTSRTGIAELSFYQLIRTRKVRSVRVGKFWFVELASLIAHLGPEASKLLGLKPSKPLLPPER